MRRIVIRLNSNFIILSALLLSAVYLAGCGAHAVSPVTGLLHTDVKGPVMATSNTIEDGYASGSASATSILGLIAKGDASVETAARNGGITKIYFVNHSSENILGIFATYTTTVYGERGRPPVPIQRTNEPQSERNPPVRDPHTERRRGR